MQCRFFLTGEIEYFRAEKSVIRKISDLNIEHWKTLLEAPCIYNISSRMNPVYRNTHRDSFVSPNGRNL